MNDKIYYVNHTYVRIVDKNKKFTCEHCDLDRECPGGPRAFCNKLRDKYPFKILSTPFIFKKTQPIEVLLGALKDEY